MKATSHPVRHIELTNHHPVDVAVSNQSSCANMKKQLDSYPLSTYGAMFFFHAHMGTAGEIVKRYFIYKT